MDQTACTYVLAGASLGLSAGLAPGPLLSLVLSQAVTHGAREGAKVALAPLVTDAPILALAWFVLGRLEGRTTVLGVVALVGAAVLSRYAWECLFPPPLETAGQGRAPRSLWRGVVANCCNPHPYVFWFTVGMPTVLAAATHSPGAVAGFIGVFYAAIVGSKIAMAMLAGRFRPFLASRAYRVLLAGLGLSLFFFAFTFARQGFAMLF